MPKGYLGGQEIAKIILDRLKLDSSVYRVGLTKVFFRAGVLAELEEQRDTLIREIMSRFQSVARGFMQRRVAYKQLYRAEATRVIQRNLNVYLDLQASPWWKLFIRMRPLLGATRTASEVKKRDERIEQLQSKMKQDVIDRQKVDEDRRRAEMDVQRIQQTLESERALALDKEEIFKRLQLRENELTEKLSEAITEQEALEDELDAATQSRKDTEVELVTRREQVVQAGQIITRLETDKRDLQGQMQRLDQQLESIARSTSQNDNKVETLDQEIRSLKSQLGLKERKLIELESGVHQAEREKDLKSAALEQEVRTLKSQVSTKDRLSHELEGKLADLKKAHASDRDKAARSYEHEIQGLTSQLNARDRKLADVESHLQRSLQHEQDLESRLATAMKELNTCKQGNRDLHSDQDALRRKVEQLSSASHAHEVSLRQKDDELSGILAKLQSQVADQEALQKENKRLLSRHDEIHTKHTHAEGELRDMKSRKTKMESEAAEVKRRLENSLAFFNNHF